jgi:hypothetical protein
MTHALPYNSAYGTGGEQHQPMRMTPGVLLNNIYNFYGPEAEEDLGEVMTSAPLNHKNNSSL